MSYVWNSLCTYARTISVRDLYNSRSLDGWSDRGDTYCAEDSVRGRSCKVLRVGKEHDARRRGRNAETAFRSGNPQTPWCACPRAARDRNYPHRSGRTLLWRISGIFPGHGLQLSNTRRSLQSSHLKRTKQALTRLWTIGIAGFPRIASPAFSSELPRGGASPTS